MAAAAALVVLMAASWFFFLRSPLTSAQRMASQYLEQPFRLNQGNTRGAESIEKNRGKASIAFDMKEYEQSLGYLRIIESDGQAKAPDYFQMGLCLMYQKTPDYTKAIDAFNVVNREEAVRAGVRYVDVTPVSREVRTDRSFAADDGLHPSATMYAKWVELALPAAKDIARTRAIPPTAK